MTDSDNKNEECIKMFCKTVAELNTISLKQMEGLLNIAVTAAKDLKSGGDNAEKFVNELKATAEQISQNAKNQEEELYKNVKAALSAAPEHSFCEAVEEKLQLAFDNSIAFQQQLNEIGGAILSKAASLILSPNAEINS